MAPSARISRLLTSAGCVALLLLTSCGGKPGPITADMTEYNFKLSQNSAKAGSVSFQIANKGSVTHEFVVEKTDLTPDKLPMSSDGSVDEEKLTSMGEQGDIEAGKTVNLTIDFHDPGHYVIICNLPGHFQKGMYSEFTITQ